MFCQHCCTGNGLFVGKLESDKYGFKVLKEIVPKQGDVLKNKTIVVIDFQKQKAWKLNDEWITFSVVRATGRSFRPTILTIDSSYRDMLFEDCIDLMNIRKL